MPTITNLPAPRCPTWSPETRAAWRVRYGVEAGSELQVRALLERAEGGMRLAGEVTTIRTVWTRLADRAAAEGVPEVRAAAALAGMAMGLQPS